MSLIKAVHQGEKKPDIDLTGCNVEIGEGDKRLIIGVNPAGQIFMQAAGGGLYFNHSTPDEMTISIVDGASEH